MNDGLCPINNGSNGSQKTTERKKSCQAQKSLDRENTILK